MPLARRGPRLTENPLPRSGFIARATKVPLRLVLLPLLQTAPTVEQTSPVVNAGGLGTPRTTLPPPVDSSLPAM
ncbi:hypothetical protein VDGE_30264 [Verticillium dahliae]|uniref:Uncharacterized protein n=1 Tax=Verticillium dahliae TaxID=27337 RepID=A0A444S3Y5_VERDA|nr:hypothetical protein VDGE_30264 [Verticillium dahliae]